MYPFLKLDARRGAGNRRSQFRSTSPISNFKWQAHIPKRPRVLIYIHGTSPFGFAKKCLWPLLPLLFSCHFPFASVDRGPFARGAPAKPLLLLARSPRADHLFSATASAAGGIVRDVFIFTFHAVAVAATSVAVAATSVASSAVRVVVGLGSPVGVSPQLPLKGLRVKGPNEALEADVEDLQIDPQQRRGRAAQRTYRSGV
jgi:hypothetical protein